MEFYSYRRGTNEEYDVAWFGDELKKKAVAAAWVGIDAVTKEAAELAKATHGIPDQWTPRTGQTQDAVFQDHPLIHRDTLQVWGRWGVRDLPHIHPGMLALREVASRMGIDVGDRLDSPVSTEDVAMFLEFGTEHARPYPWLYPVWDATKVQLPDAIKAAYDAMGPGWNRVPGLGFVSFESFFGGFFR